MICVFNSIEKPSFSKNMFANNDSPTTWGNGSGNVREVHSFENLQREGNIMIFLLSSKFYKLINFSVKSYVLIFMSSNFILDRRPLHFHPNESAPYTNNHQAYVTTDMTSQGDGINTTNNSNIVAQTTTSINHHHHHHHHLYIDDQANKGTN